MYRAQYQLVALLLLKQIPLSHDVGTLCTLNNLTLKYYVDVLLHYTRHVCVYRNSVTLCSGIVILSAYITSAASNFNYINPRKISVCEHQS